MFYNLNSIALNDFFFVNYFYLLYLLSNSSLCRTTQVIWTWVITQHCATTPWPAPGTVLTTQRSERYRTVLYSLQTPTCCSTAASRSTSQRSMDSDFSRPAFSAFPCCVNLILMAAPASAATNLMFVFLLALLLCSWNKWHDLEMPSLLLLQPNVCTTECLPRKYHETHKH